MFLQNLLDLTIARLFESLQEVLESLQPEHRNDLYLVSKWGCDGSSGMDQYKKRFSDENVSDANVFLTSIVPI